MHDPACEELARTFLPDDASKEDINSLAERLQESAEEWLEEEGFD